MDNENIENKNVAETVRDIMTKNAGFEVTEISRGGENCASVAVLPEGKKLQSLKPLLDEYLPAPERRKGQAVHYSLDSLIDHVNRFKDKDSALFADPNYKMREDGELAKAPSITAVLDYHRQGAEGAPRFGGHTSFYEFPLSDEWKDWAAQDGKVFGTQEEFAEFIESNIDNIYVYEQGSNEKVDEYIDLVGGKFASPTRLMELSRGLSITATASVKQKVNTNTGETTLQYVEEHDAGGGAENVTIPNAFMIAIPVFLNGPVYSVIVRLRYRLRSGKVFWFYEMYRKDKVFDDAFHGACEDARTKTEIPLFVGKHE